MSIYDESKKTSFAMQIGFTDEKGRAVVNIECPFCSHSFIAHNRSMAGRGKKCPECGAIHYWMSETAYPIKKVPSKPHGLLGKPSNRKGKFLPEDKIMIPKKNIHIKVPEKDYKKWLVIANAQTRKITINKWIVEQCNKSIK